jgi:hypothetical protein
MITEVEWKELKNKESYNMWISLKKDIDRLIAENFELSNRIQKLEQHIVIGEFCPHTQK